MQRTDEVCLVLSGGNALGAYAAGAVQAVCEAGWRPDLISSASIGAVTGALLAGHPQTQWVDRLREFWRRARSPSASPAADHGMLRSWHNAAHALHALSTGRPGLFHPRLQSPAGLAWPPSPTRTLFDNRPLLRTLQELVDFDRLNAAGLPLLIHCVDLATGEPVVFDNRVQPIRPEHVLASTGLVPAFAPVAIDGRWLGDPGLLCNLPLDPVLQPGDAPHRVVIAIDLFSVRGRPPTSLDEAAHRAQDIAFGSQTERTLAAFRREQRLRHRLAAAAPQEAGVGGAPPTSVDVLLCAYHAPAHELAAKTLEFSSASLDDRWQAGQRDMTALLQRHARREAQVMDDGFALYRNPSP